MSIAIDFASAADLPAPADLLGELFRLKSDFQQDRDSPLAAGLMQIASSRFHAAPFQAIPLNSCTADTTTA